MRESFSCAVILVLVEASFSGCARSSGTIPEKALQRDPTTVLRFFQDSLRAERYNYAYHVLSASTREWLDPEGTVLITILDRSPSLRRALLGFREDEVCVDGETGTLSVSHPWLRYSGDLRIEKEFGVIWTIRLEKGDYRKWLDLGKERLYEEWDYSGARVLLPPDVDFAQSGWN